MPTNGPLTTIENVVEAMYTNFSNLEHNTEYTLGDLVGKDRWLATHTGHRKQLGVQFKHLVHTTEQPVVWVRCGTDNSQIYALK
jgi:hypothetical protein